MERARWTVKIVVMKHRDSFTFPVLQYLWGTEDELTGGFVRVWSSLMKIEVKSQREDKGWTLNSVAEALAVISVELTDMVPPSIKEAFNAMIELRKAENIVDAKSAQKVFDKIETKWEEMFP